MCWNNTSMKKKMMVNDKYLETLIGAFPVPERVADKIKIFAEKSRGGYTLYQSHPDSFSKNGSWIKSEVAKFTFDNKSSRWLVSWLRSTGQRIVRGRSKSFSGALNIVKKDKHACFWG